MQDIIEKLSPSEAEKLGFGRAVEDYRGRSYNRLTIVDNLPKVEGMAPGHRLVLVQCSCNSKPFAARLDNVIKGRTKSCGCLLMENRQSKRRLVAPLKGYTKM